MNRATRKAVALFHLTLCGYYAGQTLCGAPKTADDLHAIWAPKQIIESDECCPECRKLWDEAALDVMTSPFDEEESK